MVIDYQKIADAITYYKKLNYQYIEVPWFVSKNSIDITKPPSAKYFNTFAGQLVGSGEQSFLEIRRTLKKGFYQCVTPCFRDEDITDKYRRTYFLKLELIEIGSLDKDKSVDSMLQQANKFFEKYHPTNEIQTDIGFDLMINNIEVGSYGYREYNGFLWIYGTGIAEPRLSQAINVFTQ
jgi:hypothetical protein